MPQDTIPLCTCRLSLPEGHTKGAPPSPWHVSTPGCPPAQIKDESKRKRGPRRVPCSCRWHTSESTTGSSTRFMMTLYLPAFPNTSLPHPDATHVAPVFIWPWRGRQTGLMCWSSTKGLSTTNRACRQNKIGISVELRDHLAWAYDVVGQGLGVVAGVGYCLGDGALLVRQPLFGRLCVPFASPDLNVCRWNQTHAVIGRQDHLRVDQAAPTQTCVVGYANQSGCPWKLTKAGLVLQWHLLVELTGADGLKLTVLPAS